MKDLLRMLLANSDLGRAMELVAGKRRLLGTLLSITFDNDPLIAWRAVDVMGMAADRIAEHKPDYVVSQLRRLHWLLSEEAGGICLFAPPAMAEIIRPRPGLFADFIPLVVSLPVTMEEEDLEHFRPNVLWALGRLAPVAADEIESVIPAVVSALDDPRPQVRGIAVWCLGQAGKSRLLAERDDLPSDDAIVEIYDRGNIRDMQISDLTRKILSSDS